MYIKILPFRCEGFAVFWPNAAVRKPTVAEYIYECTKVSVIVVVVFWYLYVFAYI